MNPPTPSVEKCPKCGSDDRSERWCSLHGAPFPITDMEAEHVVCPDPWHDGSPETDNDEALRVALAGNPFALERLAVIQKERDSAIQERDDVKRALRWVMTSDIIDINPSRIPAHFCGFTNDPESGWCEFHDRWVSAAEVCGLLNEWAEDDTALAPPTPRTKGEGE